MKKNIAIILAGGKGIRFGGIKPKQFLKVSGKMVLEHAVEAFHYNPYIDEIAIVCSDEYRYLIEEIVSKNNYNKVRKILNGGKDRANSSLSAINAYCEEDVNLIFHDAVRPLVTEQIITDCIMALKHYNAIDVAIPSTDTIIHVDNELISEVPDRSKLWLGQTPQAFDIKIISKAYEIALKDPCFKATDDCGIVKKYLPKEKIFVVLGSEYNIKLTYENDLLLIDNLFRLRTNTKSQIQHNLNLLKNKVIVIFGGSYGIGHEIAVKAKFFGMKVYSFSRTENATDVSKIQDVKEAFAFVANNEDNIDFVINTASVLHTQSIYNMNYQTINSDININYFGNIVIAKESFKYLRKSSGSLLLFGSSSYTYGRANYAIYSSVKAAIVNFTQALASEWQEIGIRVNCVSPERTNTPMRRKVFGNENPKLLLTATHVADVAIETILSSMTGQIIHVRL